MYFPYFRGRQYELLALRDLATKGLITNSVHPIIEPVKLIPALKNSLAAFNTSNLSIGLILNPNVGDLADESETIDQLLNNLETNPVIIPSILLNESTEVILRMLSNKGIQKSNILTVLDDRDYLTTYSALFKTTSPKYTLCPDDRQIRRASHHKVLFEDKFKKRSRNADYPEDEFFSDNHIYYDSEDYLGFGDYSIVGNEYTESGFAPYAVAIHIVYFAEDDSLRIRHFISDSNDDISDVAGKFYEAVSKLYRWYSDGNHHQLTTGLQTLLDHYHKRTYPGLPTLKKLSIMHHLELVGKYLDERLPV
ncbi:sce7725 family protein [Scatolibacter rhodanostii]|uniref:sce7725 family protein n=1 Tax=Scatolibacter rhodanostii TaxID=2014781 RepID=UPI000C08726E|nr:sce7725 family protein [Scatolibacter rhodanostii]